MTHQILHGCLRGLVDPFHELKHVVSETVNYSNADIVVIFVLHPLLEWQVRQRSTERRRTEYEFSPSSDDPVARMFGE